MKNTYKYFDSVSEFGRLGEDVLKSCNSFYCYINNTFIDRVVRVAIEKDDDLFYVAKLYYKGSRSLFSKFRSVSVFGCCRKVYDSFSDFNALPSMCLSSTWHNFYRFEQNQAPEFDYR